MLPDLRRVIEQMAREERDPDVLWWLRGLLRGDPPVKAKRRPRKKAAAAK